MTIFHLLTFIISFVILIGLILFVSLTLFEEEKVYPPDFTDCPDYWKVNPDGTCQIPHPNSINMGTLKYKSEEIYKYNFDASGNVTESSDSQNPSYNSYLSKYNSNKVGNIKKTGIEQESGVKYGYYQSDIPHGYDMTNPMNDSIDFRDPGWALYGDPYCEIRRWAIRHNIQWDGILNYNKC